jgi:hypothetical protein
MQSRKKKLINPGLQLRLVAIFLCSAALAVQAEAILITYTLTKLAEDMPNDGSVLLSQLPEFVRTNLLLTFALLAPLTLGVGIVATFRIAGPLYRFQQFLQAVKEGRQVEPCTIRKGDELHDFCILLNDVTAPLRAKAQTQAPETVPAVESVAAAIPAPRAKESESAKPTEKSKQRVKKGSSEKS